MKADKTREIFRHLLEFNKHNVPDIFQETRERSVVEHRQLFHTIMRKKYKYTFQSIADFMTFYGKPTKHDLIMYSVKRTLETNYYNSDSVAKIYDQYLDDKREERIAKMSVNLNKVPHLRARGSFSSVQTKLQELVRDIPKEREQEIYDLVLMRVKSWSWKNKDNCKIVEGL